MRWDELIFKLFDFYLEIRTIIEKNSVNSLVKLLDIKHKYKDIEARYKPHTEEGAL